MTNLKEINFGLNVYCGPAVLSALTGRSTDECASVISGINGQREIKAVNMTDIVKALKKLRFSCEKQKQTASSLFGVLTSLSNHSGMYIITVPKHIVAVEVTQDSIYLIDNHTKSPIPAGGSARLMQQVDGVYKVVELAVPKFKFAKIEIQARDNKVYINSHNYYEDPNDDTIAPLGNFRFMMFDEFEEIVNELNKFIHLREDKSNEMV